MISIRPARESDAAVMALIGLRAWEDAAASIGLTQVLRENARSAFENFTLSSWQRITVAELNGAVSGWAACEKLDDKITDFWVAPAFQRKGIGSRLLGVLERQIVARGFLAATLESHAHNDPALSFFRKHDYTVSWLSTKYSRNLDRDVQSVGLEKQFVTVETAFYGPTF